MTLSINAMLMRQIEDAAQKEDTTPKELVERVMYAHFEAEHNRNLPSHKDIIIGNMKCVADGAEFVVTDIMDSIHKTYPSQRRTYGQVLALLIARRTIRAEFTGKYRGTLKVYRKQ